MIACLSDGFGATLGTGTVCHASHAASCYKEIWRYKFISLSAGTSAARPKMWQVRCGQLDMVNTGQAKIKGSA